MGPGVFVPFDTSCLSPEFISCALLVVANNKKNGVTRIVLISIDSVRSLVNEEK
jgi:uncharacterized protein YifN (PemK superfamily)